MKRLATLPAGALFRDCNGQAFVKTGVIVRNRKSQIRHQIRCLWSPFASKLGHASSAFFSAPGDVMYLAGNQEVAQ